jgi:phytanoyl-CoA hydroxylase
MLTEDQVKQFDWDGFLVGSVILDDREIEKLRDEIELVLAGKSASKPILNWNISEAQAPTTTVAEKEILIQIVNVWMASPAFLAHAANPTISEEVAQLCRTRTLRIWHDQVLYKMAGNGGPLHWHQDHPCWPVIEPADLVTAWVPLDDATVDNGCMWMVPGSHRWGNQMAYLTCDKDFMPVHKEPNRLPVGASPMARPIEVKRGQVSYHHCLTWHGSPHNQSDRKRRAIAVHYMPGHTYFAPKGQHPLAGHITSRPGEIVQGESFPVVHEQSDAHRK